MGDRARATDKVRVAFQDADQKLFPEMSATVYFLPEGQTQPVEQPAPRIFCPNDALHSANDQSWVWIVNRDDRLQKTTVQIAERREDRTEIASGLTGGDFRDGLAVKPAQ
jgi:hypothetical protein